MYMLKFHDFHNNLTHLYMLKFHDLQPAFSRQQPHLHPAFERSSHQQAPSTCQSSTIYTTASPIYMPEDQNQSHLLAGVLRSSQQATPCTCSSSTIFTSTNPKHKLKLDHLPSQSPSHQLIVCSLLSDGPQLSHSPRWCTHQTFTFTGVLTSEMSFHRCTHQPVS